MTADASPPDSGATTIEKVLPENRNLQVRLKSEEGRLLIILPSEAETTPSMTWNDLWEQFKQRLNGSERFWQPQAPVHLIAQDRLLDGRQLQAIADALSAVQLQLKLVKTSRRQTAVAAATAGYSVEQQQPTLFSSSSSESNQLLADPLYLQTTVRSGMDIRHPGSVVILGDINPGGNVVAAGDILVWGRLRGIAHAGASGNSQCLIMALQMQPTQIRIADYVARAPETPPPQYYPEIAHVTPEGIRITPASDFSKSQFSKMNS